MTNHASLSQCRPRGGRTRDVAPSFSAKDAAGFSRPIHLAFNVLSLFRLGSWRVCVSTARTEGVALLRGNDRAGGGSCGTSEFSIFLTALNGLPGRRASTGSLGIMGLQHLDLRMGRRDVGMLPHPVGEMADGVDHRQRALP
jgi:hypothetical protein